MKKLLCFIGLLGLTAGCDTATDNANTADSVIIYPSGGPLPSGSSAGEGMGASTTGVDTNYRSHAAGDTIP